MSALSLINIKAAAQLLLDYISEYESDTFSASGSGLTQQEAEAITAALIERQIDAIDGVAIDVLLAELRAEQ